MGLYMLTKCPPVGSYVKIIFLPWFWPNSCIGQTYQVYSSGYEEDTFRYINIMGFPSLIWGWDGALDTSKYVSLIGNWTKVEMGYGKL